MKTFYTLHKEWCNASLVYFRLAVKFYIWMFENEKSWYVRFHQSLFINDIFCFPRIYFIHRKFTHIVFVVLRRRCSSFVALHTVDNLQFSYIGSLSNVLSSWLSSRSFDSRWPLISIDNEFIKCVSDATRGSFTISALDISPNASGLWGLIADMLRNSINRNGFQGSSGI